MRQTSSIVAALLTAVGAAVLAPAAPAQQACGEPLTLRVSDAIAPPGGLAAVVLRTYASRPVGQGQIDLRMGFSCGGCFVTTVTEGAVVGLESVEVFSSEDDETSSGTFDAPSQTASLEFLSPTASVNDQDGPLAVYWLQLSPDLAPGDHLALDLLPEGSFLVDGEGQPVSIAVRGGELVVRAPGAPYLLEAEGDSVVGGQLAELGVATAESFSITGGQVAVEWNPAIAAGPAENVRIDPRYGAAELVVEESVPGRLVVSFTSHDGSLNSLPGSFLQFGLRIATGAAGPAVPITLDAAATSLQGAGGAPLSLALLGDEIQFDGGHGIFHDGFECGATGAWSPQG